MLQICNTLLQNNYDFIILIVSEFIKKIIIQFFLFQNFIINPSSTAKRGNQAKLQK